ncbi:uncharacterized protein LOC130160019 isoform X2 [Falco biarmicus]|uniref:uncharacterized protein LOC130160019 isoform X2 n=1 Tax=Falco biarmicus TaxID=345155 RepID=UPI0024BCE8BC|nr:uncharacterized protein LOC130160019 isoform X2 [Falco biarmicus]
MGYAYGPGRWVHFRPAGAAVAVRGLRREPGSLSGRDVRRRWVHPELYVDKSRGATLKGVGRPERLEASAVVCGEAVSLLRERVASKRIVVLWYQADTTDLNLFCEKGSQGNVLMLKRERWRGKRFEHQCHGCNGRAAAGHRAQAV